MNFLYMEESLLALLLKGGGGTQLQYPGCPNIILFLMKVKITIITYILLKQQDIIKVFNRHYQFLIYFPFKFQIQLLFFIHSILGSLYSSVCVLITNYVSDRIPQGV